MLSSVDFDHIRKTKWYRQGGAGRPGYFYIPFSAAMKICGRKNVILAQDGLLHHGFFNKDVEYKVAVKYLKKQLGDKKYIDRVIARWFVNLSKINGFVRAVDFKNLSSLKDSQIIKLFKKFTQLDFKLWELGIHIETFDPWADSIINGALEKERVKLSKEEIVQLLASTQSSFIQWEEKNLCRIALLLSNIQMGELKKHRARFYWLQNDWANTAELDVNYFKQRMDDLLKLGRKQILDRIRKIKDEIEHNKQRQKKIIHQYRLSQKLQSLFYFFRRMTYWRDERKQAALINNNCYCAFFQEFARRTGVSYDAITFATPAEIIASRLKLMPAFKKYLGARTKRCLYYWDRQECNAVVLIGKDYDRFMKVLSSTFAGQFGELKGIPASRGIVRGTVKIINTPDDFKKMKQGDILIAPMTRPEYLPLMKKAAAIVTDESGVTCHAAIVSRELGIPCIVGTQVATEVLRDGDEVEVDADSGIIRKVS